MKNIFFVSANGWSLNENSQITQTELIEQVNSVALDANAIPSMVKSGWVVYKAETQVFKEFGAVVAFEDEAVAKKAALYMKNHLRQGAYLLVLDPNLEPNLIFSTYADYNPDLKIENVVNRWKRYAEIIDKASGTFVPALMYEDTCGVRIAGNINVRSATCLKNWRDALEKIIQCLNSGESIFILKPSINPLKL